jgi:hypothetical protein
VVEAAISELTGCAPGNPPRCILGEEKPQVYMDALVRLLRAKGIHAGQHRSGITDQISVARTCEAGVVWENYQWINYGDQKRVVRWLPGSAGAC